MSTFEDQSFLRRPVGALTRKDEYEEARARIFGEDRSTSKGDLRPRREKRGAPRGSRGSGINKAKAEGKAGGKAGAKANGTADGKNGKNNGANEPEPTGALLSLDEISYDRDMKWYNVASDARPRPAMEKGGRAYSEMERITHDTSEHAKLDEHYQALDRRKERRDREARGGNSGGITGAARSGPVAGDEIKILKPVGNGGRRRQLPGELRGEKGEGGEKERGGRGEQGERTPNLGNLTSRSIMDILTANQEKKPRKRNNKQRSSRGKGLSKKKGGGGDANAPAPVNPHVILARPDGQAQGEAQWGSPGQAQWGAQGQAQGYELWSTPLNSNDDVGDFDNMLRDIGRARALDIDAAEWVPPAPTVGATTGVSPLVAMNTQAPEWVPPVSTVVTPVPWPDVPVAQQAEVAEVEAQAEGDVLASGEVHDDDLGSADESDEEIVLNPGLDRNSNHSPPPAVGEFGVS